MIPQTSHYWITNARIPAALLSPSADAIAPLISHLATPPHSEALAAVDIEVQDGSFTQLTPTGLDRSNASMPVLDLQERLIFPGFVDIHTHLDKAHTWTRTPNPNGTFEAALSEAEQDKLHWSIDDLYRRMEFAVRCSYAQGTVAIRTHLDIFENTIDVSLEAFRQLKHTWRDRVTLEAVALVTLDCYTSDNGGNLADRIAEVGGLIGGVPFMHPNLDQQLDRVFELAAERDMSLDFHTDETDDPTSMTLRQVGLAALRHQFSNSVLCGHCCNLSVQSESEVEKTLGIVKTSGLQIVSLPMCNLYLQDRQPGRMPRWRGVTLLPELHAQGIPVAIASDNCRDVFYAYGNHDPLEVLTQSIRIAQIDRPIADWTRAITATPANIMGLSQAGRIGVGYPADFVIFTARNFSELLSRPQGDRIVVRRGQAIDTTLPDYRELDDLVPH
jgi:cytosine/creatinine deaminase